jgi:hypothetical protein
MYFVMLPLMLLVLVGFATSLEAPPDLKPAPPASGAPIVARDPAPPSNQGDDAVPSEDSALDAVLPRIPALDRDPPGPQPGQAWLNMSERELRIAVDAPDAKTPGIEIVRVPLAGGSLVAQQFRLREYINFVLLLMLGISIAFQMPLVILLLGWLGLAQVDWLRKQRRYALMVCGVVSALITPADVLSMLMMLGPLYGLYEFGILLLRLAPASRVAEGRVFALPRRRQRGDRRGGGPSADNGGGVPDQPEEAAPPDSTVPRRSLPEQDRDERADDRETGP